MKKLYVKDSSISGRGLFANENIKKNEHISFVKGKKVHRKNLTKKEAQEIPLWYGLTEEWWIDPTGTIFSFLNHSCEPNAAIVGTQKLIAIMHIPANSEITIDYSMTDGDNLWEMKCECRTPSCRKVIKSIQHIPESAFIKHLPFIPKYFQNLRKKS